MSCCCPERDAERGKGKSALQYDDLKSGASAAPTTQSMKRDGTAPADDTSDARAVDWWRTRSQETNQSSQKSGAGYAMTTPDRTSSSTTQPMQLSPDGEYYWASATPEQQRYGDPNRMATVESIEVDELSAVQEELTRREIQDFLPIGLGTQRAPSLPIERTRTTDSGITDESPLNFKLVEHEEEEIDYPPNDRAIDSDEELFIVSPAEIERRTTPATALNNKRHTAADNRGVHTLHDLRHKKAPMADAEIDDYLDAAASSVNLDDELDQIVLGVKSAVPRETSVPRDEPEWNRVEGLLTRRKLKSPNNIPDAQQKAGRRSTPSPIALPGREPVSPNKLPKPEEAAAAAAAAASQIRAPSPMRDSSPRLELTAKNSRRKFVGNHLESLSTVPSNVDSDTRERYLLACRLLKATMIEKDSKLQTEDKEFLRELLTNAEQARAPSEHDIAAIETASDLLSDTESDIFPAEESRFRVSHLKEAWQKRAKELFSKRPAGTPGLVLPVPSETVKPAPVSPRSLDLPALTETSNTPESHSLRESPFIVLGRKPSSPPGVLTQPLMEALRGFFPYAKADENFWLKYTLDDHGGTLNSLLSRVQNCKHTVIGVETRDGHVFGAFCSSPWRVQPSWFGSGECFLWRLKKSRLAGGGRQRNYDFDNEMEVYPYTGHDEQIQYCTERTIAVGGGEWSLANGVDDSSPHQDEPMGIAFMLDGDLMGGETNSCATFANPRLSGKESGSNEFDIVGLEVWTLTPCLTVSEAQKLEDKRAFVERNLKRG
eukprot:scaffold3337_cov169-Amphora_coffeaeformis.AAC.29